ncbi:carotenoid biosynthesis protein [Cecembia sp.]|uniref:carotenoid biosynthesis protein n=2 Tax=Cecembia sp. TaxID=1898110 RepID=UPI0025B87159|nr:carotenoid biosynthesis protein [Cecembia sp.]
MSYKIEQETKGKLHKERIHWGEKNLLWVKILVSVFYLVGIVGMAIPDVRPFFQTLTPFHLLLTLGVMFWFHKDWNKNFLVFAALAWFLGYGSEVMGVHTGFPFGNYNYGPVLGIKLMEVPLMIGVNWLLLIYLTGSILNRLINIDWLAASIGAITMVSIDYAIEPVAIALDFWSWEGGIIPLSNYIGWFGVAFIIHMIYRKLQFKKENKIAVFLLANLVAFFLILNFIV